MPALVEVVEPTSEETAEEEPLTLNIRTPSEQALSVLIGRRGETLAAFQLLVHLMISKQADHRDRVIVDVEGYRQRREENLRSMAQRIADQVRRSGRSVMLEAMPPNERRIVHMALADFDDISTESDGEGDQRRVVVSLKQRPALAAFARGRRRRSHDVDLDHARLCRHWACHPRPLARWQLATGWNRHLCGADRCAAGAARRHRHQRAAGCACGFGCRAAYIPLSAIPTDEATTFENIYTPLAASSFCVAARPRWRWIIYHRVG